MGLIDSDGNIFGIINLVDALVISAVLLAIVAGVLYTGPFEDSKQATRYATVSLGSLEPYIADKISPGDAMPLEETGQKLVVTDVYRTPGTRGDAVVTLRVKLEGTLAFIERFDREVFAFSGTPVRSGDQLRIETLNYSVKGQVLEVGRNGSELPTEWTPVVLRGTEDPNQLRAIEEGTSIGVAGEDVIRIASLEAYPVSEGKSRFFLGMHLRTIGEAGTPRFGGIPIREGNHLPVRLHNINVSGTLAVVGNSSLPGRPGYTEISLKARDLSPEIVDAIEPGQTNTFRGIKVAEISGVRTEPARVIINSDSGRLVMQQHPIKKDVYLDLLLFTRKTDQGIYFSGEPLRLGDGLAFDFGEVLIEGRVTGIDR